MKSSIINFKSILTLFIIATLCYSCEDFKKFELPDTASKADETPPAAAFSYTQNPDIEEFEKYTFANLSNSAINYAWDFGDGNSSTGKDAENTFPGEGSYTVSLTVSDALGVSDTYTETIEVVKPEAPDTPDPVLVNADFDKIPKNSGSDCSCSAWINKDIGEQGESSSGNGGTDNVLKFDNLEPDHVYQEFAVEPNADYLIEMAVSFKGLENVTMEPSMLETRVLAGSGYVDGYDPVYYAEAIEFPQDGWGYQTVAQMEDAANNLITPEVLSNPNDEEYKVVLYSFNAGANTSVALFIRGIGGPGGGDYDYNSGEEEIRADYVKITAVN